MRRRVMESSGEGSRAMKRDGGRAKGKGKGCTGTRRRPAEWEGEQWRGRERAGIPPRQSPCLHLVSFCSFTLSSRRSAPVRAQWLFFTRRPIPQATPPNLTHPFSPWPGGASEPAWRVARCLLDFGLETPRPARLHPRAALLTPASALRLCHPPASHCARCKASKPAER